MLSNSAKYAIKAVMYLALKSSADQKIMVKDIAKPINVPRHYIAKILQDLSKKHLISSTKGPKGGFYISKENQNTSIYDIIITVDGHERINSCLLSLKNCNSSNPCAIHHLAYPEKENILTHFKNSTIQKLAEEVKMGKSVLPL